MVQRDAGAGGEVRRRLLGLPSERQEEARLEARLEGSSKRPLVQDSGILELELRKSNP